MATVFGILALLAFALLVWMLAIDEFRDWRRRRDHRRAQLTAAAPAGAAAIATGVVTRPCNERQEKATSVASH